MEPTGQLAALTEHTLFAADATRSDIEKLCAEAREHSYFGVCVNGSRVELARTLVEETNLQVIALVGFPLGADDSDAKRYETEIAADQGAHEIDVVINHGWLKDGDHRRVLRELRDIVEAADERPVKAVLEMSLLTEEEKILACELALDSGAQFVGASTGFLTSPASIDDVKLLREALGGKLGIKAAGSFRDAQTALALVAAGATRLGLSGKLINEI